MRTIVVGGGAAGITAAISAGRRNNDVIVCEKMPQLGRKILVCGAGKCNLLNENLDAAYYNANAGSLVKNVFAKFGKHEIKNFFESLGLQLYEEKGRIFPVTNQAASVLKVLDVELRRMKIPVKLNCEISDVAWKKEGFLITSKTGEKFICDKLIVACGGKTYPALGSDGSGYQIAKKFGHGIVEPVPAAVPLVVKDKICHFLQGQKVFARVSSLINNEKIGEGTGELLITKYGFSGPVILDISEGISIAINRERRKNVILVIDFFPFMDEESLKTEISRRINKGIDYKEVLTGILPNKFSLFCEENNLDKLVDSIKGRSFRVLGTRAWNEAEFTSGGIEVAQIKDSLESKLKENLYFAGEMMDVCGRRGGYNLAWAWASGFVAGLAG